MLKIIKEIPRVHFGLACSGGIDSMVMLDFLRRYPKNHFTILYFNHGTEHGQEAEEFLTKFCEKNDLELKIGRIKNEKKSKESLEEYWRNERYAFFDDFHGQVITAHHLQDSIETYIFTALRGHAKLIPYQRGKYLRPFLMVPKSEILKWAKRYSVEHIQDPSNVENDHCRNIIRNEMMPIVMKVNPGIEKTVKKLILKSL